MYSLARPLLFCLDAERAHHLGLRAIEIAYRTGTNPLLANKIKPLPTDFCGLTLANPIGLAAGLDKNGEHVDALASLGFGFIEIGTVTPLAQAGNPKPRMFRIPEYQAVINRLGFNNAGIDALVKNVERARFTGILGINIGKNKDTPNENAVDDYLICLRKAYPLASYITVNISSPNTKGLRDLQEEETLKRFLSTLREEQEKLSAKHRARKPMLLKIAPDLAETELDAISDVLLSTQFDGLICTNTTVSREMIANHPTAKEAGGLSGRPVFEKSTSVLAAMSLRLNHRIPIIGVGGVLDGDMAAAKINAGASAVQFYSGIIYRGPELIEESVEAIRALKRTGLHHSSRVRSAVVGKE